MHPKNVYKAANLDEAVKKAYEVTEKGKICLLSPAASSYNCYKNFEEKGKHYKKLVREYGKKIKHRKRKGLRRSRLLTLQGFKSRKMMCHFVFTGSLRCAV